MKPDKPSSTALLIARSLLFLSRDPALAHLIPPPRLAATVELLQACGDDTDRLLRLSKKPAFRTLAWSIERAFLPGMLAHYAVRKLRIEELVRESLEQGCEQVVVLGTGLDVLGTVLAADYPQVRFVEIDHPATARWKAARVPWSAAMPERLEVDLASGSLATALVRSEQFRRAAPTIFLAEGVLMYLEDTAIERLFTDVRQLAGPGSRFIFTFMERYRDERIRFQRQSRLVDLWLRLRGEPFLWSIQRETMPDFLRWYGMSLQELATDATFRSRYLAGDPSIPLANGDHLCVALLDSNP